MALRTDVTGCAGFVAETAREDRRAAPVQNASGQWGPVDRRKGKALPLNHPIRAGECRRTTPERRQSLGDRSDPIRLADGSPVPFQWTETLFFAGMAVAWGWTLEAKDLPEVIARMRFLADVAETPGIRDAYRRLAEPAFLRAHVGLRLNVSPEGASWWTRIMRARRDDLRGAARRALAAEASRTVEVIGG